MNAAANIPSGATPVCSAAPSLPTRFVDDQKNPAAPAAAISPRPHGRDMPLDSRLRQKLDEALSVVDDHGTSGPRLLDDASRLWGRVGRFLGMNLVPRDGLDLEALELACYALQLPQRRSRTLPTGRQQRGTLRERAEEAAELLLGVAVGDVDEMLLDRATRILHEMPHRSPMVDEARLLADAVNLDDFGAVGVTLQVILLARHGEGPLQLAEGCEARELYGYWEARLKDGFHFEAVRQIALRRLENTRVVCGLLSAELREDLP